MGLREYRRKRAFDRTPEPPGRSTKKTGGHLFIVHKHAASHLHYDLRLQMGGTLKSWAVPKGPTLDPGQKRLAVHVEDHPIDYAKFEGSIPKGQYGAGNVIIWDRGKWNSKGDPSKAYSEGKLKFTLEGQKLRGGFNLVKMGGRAGENGKNWLLIKEKDAAAVPGSKDRIVNERPESVTTRRTVEEVGPGQRAKRSRARGVPRKRLHEAIAAPRGARKGRLPHALAMQLATAVDEPPSGEDWIHEIKFDGYRASCRIQNGKASLFTRGGKDWSDRFRHLADAAAALPIKQALIDGEVVRVEEDGKTSFQALQNSLVEGRSRDLTYFAFDLVHLDGNDLTDVPLHARKETLASVLKTAGSESEVIRFSDHVVGNGPAFQKEACRHGLEGIVSKRIDSAYDSGRGKNWLKIKCLKRQEFVIGGFTDPKGTRQGLGALALGVHDRRGRLVYCGRVGTGFSQRLLDELRNRLLRLEQKRCPFDPPPAGAASVGVHWVKPALAAEVEFTGWTEDGLLRQPSFQGLREDKDAREIVREETIPLPTSIRARKHTARAARAEPATSPAATRQRVEVAGVRLTHPDKVLYPEANVSKIDLATFYESIAEHILPHVTGRPLMLLRCPDGYRKGCFYQKHAMTGSVPASIRRVMIAEKKGRGAYLMIDSLEGLISLVQMGVLEIHVWGAPADDVERPDRMIFDLDPDPAVPWDRMLEASRLIRRRLERLDLASFVKTTGGKGLHVVVPLKGRNDWDEIRDFSHAVAASVVAEAPQEFTAKMAKSGRHGKIFIDYLRNARGATAVAAYSTRARPKAPVSTPLRWEELKPSMRSDSFTIENLRSRIAKLRVDPWQDYNSARATITAAMRRQLAARSRS